MVDMIFQKIHRKRRLTAWMLSLLLLVSTVTAGAVFLPTASVSAAVTLVEYQTTTEVNYRAAPGISGTLVGTLPKGEVVQVVSGYKKSADGYTWLKLKLDGKYYYAASSYLKKVVPVTAVSVTPTSVYVPVGEKTTLKGSVTPTNASVQTLTWTSSDSTIAKVSAKGVVTAQKVGTATITAKSHNGKKATATVKVVKTIDYITKTDVNYRTSTSTAGAAKGTLSKGTVVQVIAGSSKTANGYTWVKILQNGKAYYVVKKYLTKAVPVTKVTLNQTSVSLKAGAATTLKATVAPSNATIQTLTWSSSDASIAKVSSAGKVTAVSAGTATISAKSNNGITASCKVKVTGTTSAVPDGTNMGDVSLAKYQTLYLTTYNSGTWSSSDTSIATVKDGFVYGVKKGKATITWKSGTTVRNWSVTVNAAEAVEFAYCAPNVVPLGESATFVAITDADKKSVQFEVDGKTALVTEYRTEKAEETEDCAERTYRIWEYSTTFAKAGVYTAQIRSSSSADGSSMSSTYKTADAFVVSTTNTTTSSVEERRISDQGLQNIANWEGYAAAIYLDPLTATVVPTLGYGFVVGEGDAFYNNLSPSAAWALLVEAVNGGYTTQVNKFIVNNAIRANQRQFDAMVSFSYNCGSGWWNGTAQFDLRVLLLNAVNPTKVQAKITAGESVKGTTSMETPGYSSKTQTGTPKVKIPAGTAVTVKAAYWNSTTKAAWYKVAYQGSNYFVPACFVGLTSHTFQKDMNYMDAVSFGSELLAWHHAGGNCYAGLVYRRLSEAKIFSYGDYAMTGADRSNNCYGYLLPSCIASKNWLTT